jgi:cytochrome b561
MIQVGSAMGNGWKSTKKGYGWPAIAMHWLVLVLLIAVYASMELKGIFAKGSPGRANMATWHYTLGLSVFCLAWLRLAIRLSGAEPLIDPAPPAWQARLATLMHWALYGLLFALPLLGWLTLSAKGKPVPFFGFELPALVAANESLGKWLKDIHETSATAGYGLIGLHAVAALYHHYARRDNCMKLMLPAR